MVIRNSVKKKNRIDLGAVSHLCFRMFCRFEAHTKIADSRGLAKSLLPIWHKQHGNFITNLREERIEIEMNRKVGKGFSFNILME